MLGRHRLAVDKWADTFCILAPYADEIFWHWEDLEFRDDTVYIIGREELSRSLQDILAKAQNNVIWSYVAEGSRMLIRQIEVLKFMHLVRGNTLGLMHGGNVNGDFDFPTVTSDFPFVDIVTAPENQIAHQEWRQVYEKLDKPYTFLMLNGRLRSHRKYLIDGLRGRGLLDQALWTNLQTRVEIAGTLPVSGLSEPIRLLPPEYEFAEAATKIDQLKSSAGWIKPALFDNVHWGDQIINPGAYIDTYFSLVTESVFEYHCSFRTEKVWKPMVMCHPFVVASTTGFYRDLHNLGFRTFGHLIDEGFDLVDDPVDRAQRIIDVVADICYNGPEQFLQASRDVCEYNYQRLSEYNLQEKKRLITDLESYLDKRIQV
jgi:hypothetical protein